MSYIQHREMRFPLLRHTCRVWATRYPFIQNIIYIKTTDMGRNNVLVILHNAHAMINEDKLYQAFSDTIGQIGLKRTGSKEETEFLECFQKGSEPEFLSGWQVLSPEQAEVDVSFYDYSETPRLMTALELEAKMITNTITELYTQDRNIEWIEKHSFSEQPMDFDQCFKYEINLEELKSVAHQYGAKDQSIHSILFYAGAKGLRYVLLFIFSGRFGSHLFGDCINGIKFWPDLLDDLQRTVLKDDIFIYDNLKVFACDAVEDTYYLGDLFLSEDTKKDYGNSLNEMGYAPLRMDNAKLQFLDNPEMDLNEADFAGEDRKVLVESGFKKYIVPSNPRILYKRDRDSRADVAMLFLDQKAEKSKTNEESDQCAPRPTGPRQNNKVETQDISISKSALLKWGDVVLTPVSEKELLFHPKAENAVIRSYDTLGFRDGRDKKNSKPIGAWNILIRVLQNDGVMPYTFETRKKVEKHAQTLRKKFRALFPTIKGDPVRHCKASSSYKIGFKIRLS